MKLIKTITELIWSSNVEDFLFLQKENTYFNYKLRIILELNNALLKEKNIDSVKLPNDDYKRIDKIKFLSYKEEENEELKEIYLPNYRLFKLADLIENKGIKDEEIIEKYNQLKEYYKELKENSKDININELDKNIIKLDYKENLNKFDNIKSKINDLKDNKIVKNDNSSKTKVNILMENLNKINKRNLVFKTKELKNMENILNSLNVL